MKFNIIKLTNPIWDEYVTSAYIYDFHHTSAYHQIECKENESSVLLVFISKNNHICLPLIKKKIPNTTYFDATSVYGYSGPVASKPSKEIDESLKIFFKKEFLSYCDQNKIISVFSRLHPLISQIDFFSNLGVVKNLNKTVSIDLTLTLAEQRKAFRKSNKSEINQLKGKKGYYVKNVNKSDNQEIKDFVAIYNENMKRVEAKDYYYFDFNYFKELLNNSCFDSNLLVALKDGIMTAGAIFTKTSSIMQYHLAGTKKEFSRDTPMKLILDEARMIGTTEGLKFLHLGGGVGGSDEDSLFKFKSGFSKNFFQFSVWNLIVNEEIYNELVMKKGVKEEEYPNFFPLYRAK